MTAVKKKTTKRGSVRGLVQPSAMRHPRINETPAERARAEAEDREEGTRYLARNLYLEAVGVGAHEATEDDRERVRSIARYAFVAAEAFFAEVAARDEARR